VSGDGIAVLDLRGGGLLGAIPRVAPARLAVDERLCVSILEADGVAAGFALATHLSVV
jgi:hypothetical protein